MLNFIRTITLSPRKFLAKPLSSEVLSYYLLQTKEPPWTSYFVKYTSVKDDQWGKSHFNWKVGNSNYHILRTGCYPFIKYHCTKRNEQNLMFEDYFFRLIKVLNLDNQFTKLSEKSHDDTQNQKVSADITERYHTFIKDEQLFFLYVLHIMVSYFIGIPCLAYGIAAIFLIRHEETVKTAKGDVKIYFLYPEDKGSLY